MKVLIVGKGSYLGEKFAKYCNPGPAYSNLHVVGAGSSRPEDIEPGTLRINADNASNVISPGREDPAPTTCIAADCGLSYAVDTVDSYEGWQTADFAQYDSILMVAGIAHNPKADKALYYAVNRDLAIAVAKKAKSSGVGQFVYVSTMAVYGKTRGEITVQTIPNPHPKDHYGLSKYQAEKALAEICPAGLCIVRPPMVYGPACPGNFSKLVKLARRTPIFPDIGNKRSMIYITNLCAFFAYAIENGLQGVHLPQNIEHVNTTALVREINKKIRTTRLFNPVIHVVRRFISPLDKLFGNLYYAHDPLEEAYNLVCFEESIQKSAFSQIIKAY